MAGRRGAFLAAGAAVLVAGVVVAFLVVLRPADDAGPARVTRAPATTTAAAPATATPQPEPSTTIAPRSACDRVRHGFTPRTISVPGATRAAAIVTPPRDAAGIPGTPPLTEAGKAEFAWDLAQGTRPGDRRGNVIVNAHTWPDGSALGNRLLAALHRGDLVVVRGEKVRLCYRVTERVEVPAATLMPRYYRKDGPPRLAILTCSGRRLGPGIWTRRTVWFASPVSG
jgi:hypothetical protein